MNTQAYYQAALAGLRFVEARQPTGRRFGADADALWAGFVGDLATADRLDLLLRDADAQWPGAFGARTVFDLRGVAEDEAFGAEWEGLDPVDAEELWRSAARASAATDVADLLGEVARAWGVGLSSVDVGTVAPADRLVVVGPSAIAATIAAFAAGADLDWTDQVLCVATPAAHRQLAALGAALLNAQHPTPLLSADRAALAKPSSRRLVASPDADPADLEAAKTLAGA